MRVSVSKNSLGCLVDCLGYIIISSKEKSYLNPEQPPPFTEILKYVLDPFSKTIFLICSVALLVNSIFLVILM